MLARTDDTEFHHNWPDAASRESLHIAWAETAKPLREAVLLGGAIVLPITALVAMIVLYA